MPIRLPVVLSPSRTETGCRCHRRHFLGDVVDRVRYRSGSLQFGELIHKGTAKFWLEQFHGATPIHAANEALEVAMGRWHELQPEGDKHTSDMAEALMAHYFEHARLAGDLAGDWHVKVYEDEPMIEKRLTIQVESDELSFQIDRLLENERGELAIIDTKTASRFASYWERNFDTWLQGMLYAAGVEKIFGVAPTLQVEGLQKKIPVKHRYLDPPAFDDSQLEEALMQHSFIASKDREILEEAMNKALDFEGPVTEEVFQERWRYYAELFGVTKTENSFHDCFSYYFECPYYMLCTKPMDQRLPLLQAEFDVMPTKGY